MSSKINVAVQYIVIIPDSRVWKTNILPTLSPALLTATTTILYCMPGCKMGADVYVRVLAGRVVEMNRDPSKESSVILIS